MYSRWYAVEQVFTKIKYIYMFASWYHHKTSTSTTTSSSIHWLQSLPSAKWIFPESEHLTTRLLLRELSATLHVKSIDDAWLTPEMSSSFMSPLLWSMPLFDVENRSRNDNAGIWKSLQHIELSGEHCLTPRRIKIPVVGVKPNDKSNTGLVKLSLLILALQRIWCNDDDWLLVLLLSLVANCRTIGYCGCTLAEHLTCSFNDETELFVNILARITEKRINCVMFRKWNMRWDDMMLAWKVIEDDTLIDRSETFKWWSAMMPMNVMSQLWSD